MTTKKLKCKNCNHIIAKLQLLKDGVLYNTPGYTHVFKGNLYYPIGRTCLEYVGLKRGKWVNGLGAGYCACRKPEPSAKK